MGFYVVILSKNIDNLDPCVQAIREHEPAAKVVVVDDGLRERVKSCYYVDGRKPFIFAANVNLGMRVSVMDDVIILNDDALLKTPQGFTKLQQLAIAHEDIGVLAPVTNVTGLMEQRPQNRGLRFVNGLTIPFICAYIPRRVIDAIGYLDERFTAYGWEDNDYCRRARLAGFKLAVYDGVFVDHGSLRSTFRGAPKTAGMLEAGRKIYLEKWGSIA